MQTFYPWASLTTRLWKGSEHLEVEWTVGPIPFKDGLGREISVQPFAFMWLSPHHSLPISHPTQYLVGVLIHAQGYMLSKLGLSRDCKVNCKAQF